jgi:exportin-2 (importin alpha re-exporter)
MLCLISVFPGVARVVITAKQALAGEYVAVLQKLVDILRKVAPNPSNPNFDQYIFESISGLIRFIGATVPDSIAVFESALFPPFTEILQKDIDRALLFRLVILTLLLKCRLS